MSQVIPIEPGSAFFDLQVELDGELYTLEFRWNVRLGAWFMAVLDAPGENILYAGARLVCNWPLFAYRADRKPPGALVALDTTGECVDPALEDLGVRVQLVYYTAAELGL